MTNPSRTRAEGPVIISRLTELASSLSLGSIVMSGGSSLGVEIQVASEVGLDLLKVGAGGLKSDECHLYLILVGRREPRAGSGCAVVVTISLRGWRSNGQGV